YADYSSLIFVLAFSVSHPHLHSFPTRRSSDLSPYALDWDRLLKNNPSLFGQKPWVTGSGSVSLPTVPKPVDGQYILPGGLETERSEEHTSELQSRFDLVCRLLLEKKNSD